MNSSDINNEFAEARSRLDELYQASMQDIDGALQRYVYAIRPETNVGEILNELSPKTDLHSWLKEAYGENVGMIGSRKLDWPLDQKERIFLQYNLLQEMANGAIDLSDFAHDFTYAGNNINDCNHAFVERVIVAFHNDVHRLLMKLLESKEPDIENTPSPSIGSFVDRTRLMQLGDLTNEKYDLSKVIQLCAELNTAYQHNCLFSLAALTRSLIDHVPPIFCCERFSEVSSNYPGSKSFKQSMKHLQNSARTIGDAHLHTHIRRKEVLPTLTQVNFSNDIDVLLAEIVRILKQ